MAETIPDDALHLLDDVNFAHVVTLMDDGEPQTTPVWITRDGTTPVFNTAKGRLKQRNLERDPRIAFSVLQHDNPYEYLQVRGRATMVEEGAVEQIHALAHKYMGAGWRRRRAARRLAARRLATWRVSRTWRVPTAFSQVNAVVGAPDQADSPADASSPTL